MKISECEAKIMEILEDNEISIFVSEYRLSAVADEIASFINSEWGLEKD